MMITKIFNLSKVIMLWKYLRNLSSRSELWDLWWTYFVKKWKTDNLVEFYNNSNFKNRVNTFFDDSSDNIRYLFKNWEELKVNDEKSIKKLARILSQLYNDVSGSILLEDYIEQEYKNRIKNLPKSLCDLSQYQQDIISDYFMKFKKAAWKYKVNLSRIHWDLKPDNIIVNKSNITIIDWEWCKKWNYIQDIQRFVSCLDEDVKHIFIDELKKNLGYEDNKFKFLYLFHEFLLLILWLSKDKIDFDSFISILKNGWIDDIDLL